MLTLIFIAMTEFIDCPTPDALERAQIEVKLRAEPEGGLVGYIDVGILDNFLIGVSYGGEKIIGYGKPRFYPRIGTQIKYKLWEKPKIAIGLDIQGHEEWATHSANGIEYEGYFIKSKGAYLVAGSDFKEIITWGAGANYNLTETKKGQNPFDIFGGVSLKVTEEFSLLAEYYLGLNQPQMEFPGYLSFGIRFKYEDISIELLFRDLFSCTKKYTEKTTNRTIKIVYRTYL